MNSPRALLITALGAGLLLSTSGCTKTSCSRDPDQVNVPLSEGLRVGNTYYSAPEGGPYQYFPPARTITFEHDLGGTPAVQFWLAFTAYGAIAPSAGNMTEIPAVEAGVEAPLDGHRIVVFNNTCSDFYIWVVASVPAAPLPDNDAGAAADDGSAAAAGVAGASP
jgi:hypothetical protein